ncbi:MAG TPA: alpha/beta hydrolase [Acidimicrobiales bacterium]|nr:alpha/beta hydrolase [Acidimicrobiales bacterium]
MTLTPQVQLVVDLAAQHSTTPIEQTSPAEARRSYRAFALLGDESTDVADIADRTIPGLAGDIPVRIYTPHGAPARGRPALVWFHGGGFVIGDLDTANSAASGLAAASGALVVSVDYRLAPEHRFPAAADDCFAALAWACSSGVADLAIDPDRVAVGGDSAGGNLAAAVSIMARDRGGPAIAFQLLVVPCVDARMQTKSISANGSGLFLTASTMRWFWDSYLGPDGDGSHHYASPLRSLDFTRLPPALVITAEYDPLRDEGEAYAAAMAEAGVAAILRRYDGQVHPFFGRPAVFGPEAADAVAVAGAALRAAFTT